MIELLVFPVLAGLALALSVGPLGSFVVWRKMSYFGDTLAHSGLLGVALGLLLNITPAFSTILVSLIVASLLVFLQQRSYLANDTILGILSHTSLAIGLICISIFPERLVNLNAYLIGDFLTVSQHEFWPILAVSLGCFATVVWRWKRLLAVTVDADLAKLEGSNPELNRLVLTLLTALLIAVAVRVVGVLLITALLIIPASAARAFAKSPEQMALWASFIAAISVLAGTALSVMINLPAGPAIICSAAFIYALSQVGQVGLTNARSSK